MSAVVERKSAVELRSDAAMSAGDDRTYGWPVRATPIASVVSAVVAPWPTRTSTRLTVSSPRIRCIVASGSTTVRPPLPAGGPSPARTPAIGSVHRAVRPQQRHRSARREAVGPRRATR